jgi:hypothetical protein
LVPGAHAVYQRRVIDGKDICDILEDFVERAAFSMKSLDFALSDMKRQYKSLCQFMSFDPSESAETFEIFEILQRFNSEIVKQHKISSAEAAAAAEKVRKEQAAALQKVAARARASSRAEIDRRQSITESSHEAKLRRDSIDAPSSLVSLDLARPIPSSVPIVHRKKVLRRESFCAAQQLHFLPSFSSIDDICLAFHPHSLMARMAAITTACIPHSERGSTIIPSLPKVSQKNPFHAAASSPISAFVQPSPSTRISGRRVSVRPVDVATQRATLEAMKGKQVRSALKGQLVRDIVGSVLTEIKLKRGSTASFNKVIFLNSTAF